MKINKGPLVETAQNFHEAQWKQSNYRDVSITHRHCSPQWVLSRQIKKQKGSDLWHTWAVKVQTPANTCCMITGGFITVQMWSYVSSSSMRYDNSVFDILTIQNCSVSQCTKLRAWVMLWLVLHLISSHVSERAFTSIARDFNRTDSTNQYIMHLFLKYITFYSAMMH